MKLYDCHSKEEKKLEEIEVMGLSTEELLELSKDIRKKYRDCILEDESIVIDALFQITEELGERTRY